MTGMDENAAHWEQASGMVGETMVGSDRERIGRVRGVAENPTTMEPTYFVVKTSLFGRERLVPIRSAAQVGDLVQVPFSKDAILDAPVPDNALSLSASEQEALAMHYQLRRAA
jgi:hypothetical protein